MKSLKAFALLFVLTALPVSAEIGPDGTGVVNGYQIGPDANLTGANLSDADLNGADLTNGIRLDPILTPRIAELETQLATAIHERDERPTLEQMQDARVGSVLLAADVETNEVTLNFKVEQTNDLTTWKPFSNVSLSMPLDTGKRFLRIALSE